MKFIAVLGSIFLPASLVAVSAQGVLNTRSMLTGQQDDLEHPGLWICSWGEIICSLSRNHCPFCRGGDAALFEAFASYTVDVARVVFQVFCGYTLSFPHITGAHIVLKITVITIYLTRFSQTLVFQQKHKSTYTA
jgi:hypothetical protein